MMKRTISILFVCLLMFCMAGCANSETVGDSADSSSSESDLADELGLTADSKDATEVTQEVNSF